MKVAAATALVAVSCLNAQAAITLNITAAQLRTDTGSLMPADGLVLLVAATTGSFGSPRADFFVDGGDAVLMAWGLQVNGAFQADLENFDISSVSGLESGDPLRLYWYPTLTLANYNGGAGSPGEVPYGFYWDPTTTPAPPQDGSAPWVVPNDNSTVSLTFATDSIGGSYDDSVGWANFTVAPVPEASNSILAGLGLGVVALRLVPRLRQKLGSR
jgi:hypothetical protein